MDPKWYNVNKDARVWSGHASGAHKQGWMRAPGAILAIDDYKGSVQFKEWKVDGDGAAEFKAKSGYPQLWMRLVDLSTEPYEPSPVPTPVPVPVPTPMPAPQAGDAELGAALRLLANFIRVNLLGR